MHKMFHFCTSNIPNFFFNLKFFKKQLFWWLIERQFKVYLKYNFFQINLLKVINIFLKITNSIFYFSLLSINFVNTIYSKDIFNGLFEKRVWWTMSKFDCLKNFFHLCFLTFVPCFRVFSFFIGLNYCRCFQTKLVFHPFSPAFFKNFFCILRNGNSKKVFLKIEKKFSF